MGNCTEKIIEDKDEINRNQRLSDFDEYEKSFVKNDSVPTVNIPEKQESEAHKKAMQDMDVILNRNITRPLKIESKRVDDVDAKLLAKIDRAIEMESFSLASLAVNNHLDMMKEKMLSDIKIFGNLVIHGQFVVFYAKYNTGKTLLITWLIIQAIKNGEVDSNNIYYVNADDNYAGVCEKGGLAVVYGFYMLAPGHFGFEPKRFREYISYLISNDDVKGKIIILDTVKKFSNLMDKTSSSIFNDVIRRFVMHGGTVIVLAHVNKHKGEDGKPIYAGTSDLVDDCDCAYTIDIVSENKAAGRRVIKFENFKSRGDVSSEAVYEYSIEEGLSYVDRLNSVRKVDDDESEVIQKRQYLERKLEKNRAAIDIIKEVISAGITKKTELLAEAHTRSGISKSKLIKALDEHTGKSVADYQFWHVNVGDKNAHVYQLNWGVQ